MLPILRNNNTTQVPHPNIHPPLNIPQSSPRAMPADLGRKRDAMLVGKCNGGRDVGLGGDDDDDAVLRVLALEVLVRVVREVGAVGGDDEGGLGEGWGEVDVEVQGRRGRGGGVAGGGGGGEEGEEEGEEGLEVHFDGVCGGRRSWSRSRLQSMVFGGETYAHIPFPTPESRPFDATRC